MQGTVMQALRKSSDLWVQSKEIHKVLLKEESCIF